MSGLCEAYVPPAPDGMRFSVAWAHTLKSPSSAATPHAQSDNLHQRLRARCCLCWERLRACCGLCWLLSFCFPPLNPVHGSCMPRPVTAGRPCCGLGGLCLAHGRPWALSKRSWHRETRWLAWCTGAAAPGSHGRRGPRHLCIFERPELSNQRPNQQVAINAPWRLQAAQIFPESPRLLVSSGLARCGHDDAGAWAAGKCMDGGVAGTIEPRGDYDLASSTSRVAMARKCTQVPSAGAHQTGVCCGTL